MSEQESFDILDDGEPPSPYLMYDKNWETDKSYDTNHSEYYKEHIPMWELCHIADKIIDDQLKRDNVDMTQSHKVLPDDMVSKGSMTLRRVFSEHPSGIEGEPFREVLYFLVDTETDYCRSWELSETKVHWCYSERRYEPIQDVMDRLVENFLPPEKNNSGLRRRIGNFVRKLITS